MNEIKEQITFLSTLLMEETDHFYAGILGLPLVLDQEGCRLYRVNDGAYLGFCEKPDTLTPASPDDVVVVTFVVEDVDATFEALSAKGVIFTKTPAVNDRYRIYNAFFRDPNGYLLEIQRFLHPFP